MSTVRQYELVYITPPETTEEALADLQQQVVAILERPIASPRRFDRSAHGSLIAPGCRAVRAKHSGLWCSLRLRSP